LGFEFNTLSNFQWLNWF